MEQPDAPPSHYAFTRRWLEARFSERDGDGVYQAHMPAYGHAHPAAEPGRLPRLARATQILRALDGLECRSVLDVGGAEGYVASLAAARLNITAVTLDVAAAAGHRAAELYGLPAVAGDADRLPFADDSFDVVLCSEVIEHVEHPLELLLELRRVARVGVVLTTEEVTDDSAVRARFLTRRSGYPHGERNQFLPSELAELLGPDARISGQFVGGRPVEPKTDDAARQWLLERVPTAEPADPGGRIASGIVVSACLQPGGRRSPTLTREQWIDAVLAHVVAPGPHSASDPDRRLAAMLPQLRCPLDGTPLRVEESTLIGDRHGYAVEDGVPLLHAQPLEPFDDSPEATDQRLLRAYPEEPKRRAAGRALRDLLWMPSGIGTTHWDFAHEPHRIGWRIGDDLRPAESTSAPGWRLDSTGADPNLVGPTMPWDPADIVGFEVDLRLHNLDFPIDAGTGQLFWMTTADVTFAEERSLQFPVRNDGARHTYRIDPHGHAVWRAAAAAKDSFLVCLRLDPVDGPAELELFEFRLLTR